MLSCCKQARIEVGMLIASSSQTARRRSCEVVSVRVTIRTINSHWTGPKMLPITSGCDPRSRSATWRPPRTMLSPTSKTRRASTDRPAPAKDPCDTKTRTATPSTTTSASLIPGTPSPGWNPDVTGTMATTSRPPRDGFSRIAIPIAPAITAAMISLGSTRAAAAASPASAMSAGRDVRTGFRRRVPVDRASAIMIGVVSSIDLRAGKAVMR